MMSIHWLLKQFQAFRNEKGVVLMTCYMLVALLSILSLAIFSRSSTFLQATERNQNKVIAFNMSESGINAAMTQIADGTIASFPYESGYIPMDTGEMLGGYSVTVEDVGNGIKEISATGFAPDNEAGTRAQESRTSVAYVSTGSLFNYAIFAEERLRFKKNTVIDSYDSSEADYSEEKAGANADVATNSIKKKAIFLNKEATLNGSAVIGVGGDPSEAIVLKKGATITGERSAATKEFDFPLPETSLDSEGDLKIGKNTVYELAAGEHYFTTIKVSKGGTLKALGPVEIYVDGKVDIRGTVVTHGDLPKNFIFYGLGNEKIRFHKDVTFYGAVYAPGALVVIRKDTSFYGAVISKKFRMGKLKKEGDVDSNAGFHFDEALRNMQCAFCKPEVISWFEEGANHSTFSVSADSGVAEEEEEALPADDDKSDKDSKKSEKSDDDDKSDKDSKKSEKSDDDDKSDKDSKKSEKSDDDDKSDKDSKKSEKSDDDDKSDKDSKKSETSDDDDKSDKDSKKSEKSDDDDKSNKSDDDSKEKDCDSKKSENSDDDDKSDKDSKKSETSDDDDKSDKDSKKSEKSDDDDKSNKSDDDSKEKDCDSKKSETSDDDDKSDKDSKKSEKSDDDDKSDKDSKKSDDSSKKSDSGKSKK